VSFDRKTGIFVPPEGGKDDYSEFLTGEPLADRKRVAMLLETIAEVNSSVEVERGHAERCAPVIGSRGANGRS